MMLYAAGSYHDVSVEAEVLCGVTWSGQLLWYADAGREQVVGVDPHSGESVATHSCPGLRSGLAIYGENLVYAAGPDYLLRTIDPVSGEVVDESPNPRPGQEISGLEGARQGLWLAYRELLDLRTIGDFRLVECVGVNRIATGVTVTDRFVVYCNDQAGNERVPLGIITVLDTNAGQEVLSINVHGAPTGLSWDGSRIWYCDNASSRLRAIDVPGIVRSI